MSKYRSSEISYDLALLAMQKQNFNTGINKENISRLAKHINPQCSTAQSIADLRAKLNEKTLMATEGDFNEMEAKGLLDNIQTQFDKAPVNKSVPLANILKNVMENDVVIDENPKVGAPDIKGENVETTGEIPALNQSGIINPYKSEHIKDAYDL